MSFVKAYFHFFPNWCNGFQEPIDGGRGCYTPPVEFSSLQNVQKRWNVSRIEENFDFYIFSSIVVDNFDVVTLLFPWSFSGYWQLVIEISSENHFLWKIYVFYPLKKWFFLSSETFVVFLCIQRRPIKYSGLWRKWIDNFFYKIKNDFLP